MAATWRTLFYTAAMLVLAIAIASSSSFGLTSDAPPPNDQPVLAVQSPQSSPVQASRSILLVIGLTLVGMTYRQAWLNLRSRS